MGWKLLAFATACLLVLPAAGSSQPQQNAKFKKLKGQRVRSHFRFDNEPGKKSRYQKWGEVLRVHTYTGQAKLQQVMATALTVTGCNGSSFDTRGVDIKFEDDGQEQKMLPYDWIVEVADIQAGTRVVVVTGKKTGKHGTTLKYLKNHHKWRVVMDDGTRFRCSTSSLRKEHHDCQPGLYKIIRTVSVRQAADRGSTKIGALDLATTVRVQEVKVVDGRVRGKLGKEDFSKIYWESWERTGDFLSQPEMKAFVRSGKLAWISLRYVDNSKVWAVEQSKENISESKPADEVKPEEAKPADEVKPVEAKPADEVNAVEAKPADEVKPGNSESLPHPEVTQLQTDQSREEDAKPSREEDAKPERIDSATMTNNEFNELMAQRGDISGDELERMDQQFMKMKAAALKKSGQCGEHRRLAHEPCHCCPPVVPSILAGSTTEETMTSSERVLHRRRLTHGVQTPVVLETLMEDIEEAKRNWTSLRG